MERLKTFIYKNKFNILFYLLGFMVLGFAVNLMKASTLGNGAWDTVIINVRDYLTMNLNQEWVTLGMISFTVSISLMIIVFSYRRKAKFLLMLIPILLVALSIDFWNIVVFQEWEATKLGIQILFYIFGTLLIPMGLTLIVKSNFPAFVFDELMLMFVKIFKARKITYVRLGIEILGLSIGIIFGYLTYYNLNGTLGAVDVGSFILTFTLSPIISFYFKIFKVKRTN